MFVGSSWRFWLEVCLYTVGRETKLVVILSQLSGWVESLLLLLSLHRRAWSSTVSVIVELYRRCVLPWWGSQSDHGQNQRRWQRLGHTSVLFFHCRDFFKSLFQPLQMSWLLPLGSSQWLRREYSSRACLPISQKMTSRSTSVLRQESQMRSWSPRGELATLATRHQKMLRRQWSTSTRHSFACPR